MPDPFEQVVEAMAHAAFYDGKTPWEEADSRDREEAIWGAQEALQVALDTGLLTLVEERPERPRHDPNPWFAVLDGHHPEGEPSELSRHCWLRLQGHRWDCTGYDFLTLHYTCSECGARCP